MKYTLLFLILSLYLKAQKNNIEKIGEVKHNGFLIARLDKCTTEYGKTYVFAFTNYKPSIEGTNMLWIKENEAVRFHSFLRESFLKPDRIKIGDHVVMAGPMHGGVTLFARGGWVVLTKEQVDALFNGLIVK